MAKSDYTKTPRTLEGQVALLIERGLLIPNEDKAKKVLANISFNRLSNYWFPFLRPPKAAEIFREGIEFDAIFRYYQFDSELKVLVFYAIEQIEIAVRTQLIYCLSNKYNTGFWYHNTSLFDSTDKLEVVLNSILESVKKSNQDFIVKYRENYNQPYPPAWKSFEIITFNQLVSIYTNLKDTDDLKAISSHFQLHHKVFKSWLFTLVYIRNICAHHSVLWNIVLTIKPKELKQPKRAWVGQWSNGDMLKIYSVLCIIAYLLDHINPYHEFKEKLHILLETNKYRGIDISKMGFPENWKTESLWKKDEKESRPTSKSVKDK